MLDYFEHSLALEVAVSTGASLPFVHGVFRLGAVSLAGIAGFLTLRGLARTVGARGRQGSIMDTACVIYPLVFGACVVAAGAGSPITLFPFLYMTSTAIPLLAAVLVGRAANLRVGGIHWPEATGYVLLGGVLASTFDLVYLAMPLVVVYLGVQIGLSSHTLSSAWKLRGAKALGWVTLGFVAVFLPTRYAIQQACSGGACYAASDLSFDISGLSIFSDRLISGIPVAGWRYVAETAGSGGIGWKYFLGNAGATLAAVGLIAVAMQIRRALLRRRDSAESVGSGDGASLALVAVWPGAILAGGSVLAALQAKMQADMPAIGFGWRDSGFAAVGWAMLLCLGLAALIEATDRQRWRALSASAVVAVLVVASAQTYLSNASLAESASRDPESLVNNRIAIEIVDFDRTDLGNGRRCQLLDDFSDVFHDRQYDRDVQLEGVLDWISERRYHVPFCDDT